MITCSPGVFLMEPGARTAITSYGGSGIGTGTTIKSCIDVQPASNEVVPVAITLSAIRAMWVNSAWRSARSRRKVAVVSQATARNGYGHPWLRIQASLQFMGLRSARNPIHVLHNDSLPWAP
jgi:hypothetical protein